MLSFITASICLGTLLLTVLSRITATHNRAYAFARRNRGRIFAATGTFLQQRACQEVVFQRAGRPAKRD